MLSVLAFVVMVFASLGAFAAIKNSTRGNITMKISKTVAQIDLGNTRLKVGQRLAVFQNKCHGGRFSVCESEQVGTATVTKVHDQKFSEIAMENNTYFEEGYKVEVVK